MCKRFGYGQMGSTLMVPLQTSLLVSGLEKGMPCHLLGKQLTGVPTRLSVRKKHLICSGPLSVDPIGPQPVRAGMSTACKDVANVYLDTEITLRDIFASSLVFHRFFSSTLK